MDDGPSQGILNKLKFLLRRLGNSDPADKFEEDIQDLIEQGAEKGVISPGAGEMIQSIVEFGETVAREIMVPRTGFVAVPQDAPLKQFLDLIIKSGHSRLPIYEGDIDHIVGVLHAKDLLAFWNLSPDEHLPDDLKRKPIFASESKKIGEILAELRAHKSHMAILLDEYGGTAGLVTIEDIIEEIVGEILDEYDDEEKLLTQVDETTIIANARLNMEDLENHLEMKFPDGEFETLGGFITDLTGKVPHEKERIEFQDLVITILSADERKIKQVEIKHPPLTSGSAAGNA